MMLLLTQAIFAGSLTFIRNNIYLLPAITLFSLAQVLLASTTMLALSSMSKSARFVAVMYAGLFFFTTALFQALRGITGTSRFAWMSPSASLEQLGDVIFRLQPRYQLSAPIAVVDRAGADRRIDLDPDAARPRRGDRHMTTHDGESGTGSREPAIHLCTPRACRSGTAR